MTEQKLQKEIEQLDQETREALDRLADRREELARQHRATELAEGRRREREEERRRQDAEEAEKKAREQAKARREEISRESTELTAELEGLADRILEGLERLKELDDQLVEEVAKYDTERANNLVRSLAGRNQRWLEERFAGA